MVNALAKNIQKYETNRKFFYAGIFLGGPMKT
jgi:hypothetical protein